MMGRGRGLRKHAHKTFAMIKSFKYRLYPNKEQQRRLEETLTTCRFLYNDALATRIHAYKEEGKSLTYFDQCKTMAANKNDWQRQVYSHVLQATLYRLNETYKRFFEARKAGKAHGFPRFKPAQRYNSFCFPDTGFKLLENNHLRLSKIGDIRITLHRQAEGTVKTCTILRDIDQWFAVLVYDVPPMQTACEFPDAVIGVDMGLTHFATLSTGETVENPRHFRASEKKLAKLQRRMARKKKGSKNRQKARVKVARCHRRIKNQRQDFLHKESARLAKTYGLIVFEKLNIRGMVKNRRLAKSISDAGWNQFITYTTYKATSAGGCVELVDARNTSQNCSGCGRVVPKALSVRVHSCPSCGLKLDRDHNAAINIKKRNIKSKSSRREPSGLRVEAA